MRSTGGISRTNWSIGKNLIEVKVTAPDAPRWGANKDEKTVKAALAALVKITLP